MILEIFYSISALLAGLFFLWRSSDIAVRQTLKLASAFGLTTFFSGFVIMAIASGIPELSVALSSIFSGVSQVSAGDIIGSNFSDISFVLGLVVFIAGSIHVFPMK